jgi:hypothetical protein
MILHRFVLASLLGCSLVTPLVAGEAQAVAAPTAPSVTAVAAVTSIIQALRGNDLSAWYDALPEAQRTAMTAPPANADQQRGNRRGGAEAGLLRMFADEQRAGQAGAVLGSFLVQLAVVSAPEGTPPPVAAAPVPEDQRFLMFVPRMLASGVMGGAAGSILAQGLETRQVAALDGLAVAYRTWAAGAGLADAARATAAQPHLQAAIQAIRPLAEGDAAPATRDLLLAVSAAMPHAKLGLAAFGLDVDAILATATASLESETAGRAVVVLRFSAWGAEHAVPLVMQSTTGVWSVVADSPAIRWLRPAMIAPQMGGRGPGGRGQRGGAPRPESPAVPADQPAAQPPRNF